MPWKNRVENLRKYVEWECKDIPPDLVLAIINNESGGQAGIKAKVKCKAGPLPTVSGNTVTVNRALGLMQAIPATVSFYNDSAPDGEKATYEDMIGDDDRAKRLQIRVGCKFLAFVNHYLHKKLPSAAPAAHLSDASPSQIQLVLTGYAVGHGATAKKIKQLPAGKPHTFASVKDEFPDWGKRGNKWINRPIFYAEKVFTKFTQNKKGGTIPDVVKKPVEIVKRSVENVNGKGAFIAIVFLAGAGWFLNRHFSKPRGTNADT